MSYNTILVETQDKVQTITLNRPRVLNALSTELWGELKDALEKAGDNPEANVLVITGAGKAFSAGTDLKEVSKLMPGSGVKLQQLMHDTITTARYLPKPVICAVRGYCIGGAVELMIGCDMVVASETASFCMKEMEIGIPNVIEAALLVATIGALRAKEFCYTADWWDAQKAEKVGLVNEVVADAQLETRVREVAVKMASKDALALAVQKDIINKWLTTDLETAMDYSMMALLQCQGSEGQKEGMKAFVEK
ncbi:MAG: enoyl-CoA hydratase/isomerase family protein [Chromatiales bacterium]|nr:enoyl-CoA hydratase/isomerase family protein [Chromatiales bacterium]